MDDVERRFRQGGRFRRVRSVARMTIAVLGAAAAALAGPVEQHRTWRDYGGGPDQSKYVVLDDITRDNVHQLEVAWTYPSGDDVAYQFNPIIVGDEMYVLAKNHSLVALDARTGRERWIHANLRGITRRGVNYWQSEDGRDRRLLFCLNNTLQAIDADTGQSITRFGDNGIVDLRVGLDRDPASIARVQSSGPGRIFENLILLGSSPGEAYLSAPGHLRAYDVVTGDLVWTFRTIPHPGEYGYDTWPPEAYRYVGGANTWGEISLDEQRGIAYFPVGSPTYDFYGADRHGTNLFGSSLVALDARTGRRLWHFQFVHHDLWDYDPTAAPQLVTVEHEGRSIDAVAQATKHGFLFVFDRVTGEPLWPIEERAVPPSHVPGEQAWPTQPFPTKLPPFARQTMSAEDLTPFFLSDEERREFEERLDAAQRDLFTPPSHLRETVSVPGAVGGANWGNTAADPRRGRVYVMNQDFPSFYKLEEPPEPGAAVGDRDRIRAVYAANCQTCHGAQAEGSLGPPLQNLGGRLSLAHFRDVLLTGRAQMPPFAHLDDATLSGLYRWLGGDPAAQPSTTDPETAPPWPTGPVVAAGGASNSERLRLPVRRGHEGQPYPAGVPVPQKRYITDYGLKYPYLMRPPWSYLVAYDLNEGNLLWKVPLGQDLHAAAEGGEGTGVPRGAQRNGMIVTSTGLIFATAKDGHVYAFDADSGETLWSARLPTGTEGLPAMFEIDGRHHLVVNATTPLTWGRNSRESGIGAVGPHPPGGYVVFALPHQETASSSP